MGRIIFREDLNQDVKINTLSENKVDKVAFNSAVNDLNIKINDEATVRKDAIDKLNAGKDTEGSVAYAIDQYDQNTVQSIRDSINILNGDKDTEGSVDKKIADAVTEMVNGAPEAYDTLKELLDYINDEDTDLNDFISQVNGKVDGLKANVSDDWNTLEKIETNVKAIRDDLQSKIDELSNDNETTSKSIPVYKYDTGLAIGSEENKVTLSLVPYGDIMGGRATVYSTDDDGNITIEGLYTIAKNTEDDAGAKDYKIEADEDLSSFKAIVEYFYRPIDNE